MAQRENNSVYSVADKSYFICNQKKNLFLVVVIWVFVYSSGFIRSQEQDIG